MRGLVGRRRDPLSSYPSSAPGCSRRPLGGPAVAYHWAYQVPAARGLPLNTLGLTRCLRPAVSPLKAPAAIRGWHSSGSRRPLGGLAPAARCQGGLAVAYPWASQVRAAPRGRRLRRSPLRGWNQSGFGCGAADAPSPADPCAEVGGEIPCPPRLAALSALSVATPRGSVPRGPGRGLRPREGVVCGPQPPLALLRGSHPSGGLPRGL
jgi:hypothetical protein